jgi:CubicO group peptidase (beta-lactamase class C family)
MRFGYGFQRFQLGINATAFGHGGIGGSFAMGDPISGVSVAITLNKLTAGCIPTKAVLKTVCDALELGELAGYWGDEASGSGSALTASASGTGH